MSSKALQLVTADEFGVPGDTPSPRQFDPSVMLEEGLAAAALAMEDYRAVVRHCSNLVQSCPDHFEAWFNLGYARQQTGEVEEAIFAYHQAARLAPRDPRPWINLGVARHGVEDNDGAREAYRAALALDPDEPRALWNLGLILEEAGGGDDAAQLYCRVTELRPDWADAWFRYGLALIRREDWPAAEAAFASCVEAQGDWREARFNLALAQMRDGRPAEAMDELDRLIDEDPGWTAAIRALAAAAVESGDWTRANTLRRKLVERKQPMPELTFNIALLAESLARNDDAVRLYCEALRENPRFSAAMLNLGHLLNRQGKRSEAVECWKRALTMDASLAAGYFTPGGD